MVARGWHSFCKAFTEAEVDIVGVDPLAEFLLTASEPKFHLCENRIRVNIGEPPYPPVVARTLEGSGDVDQQSRRGQDLLALLMRKPEPAGLDRETVGPPLFQVIAGHDL